MPKNQAQLELEPSFATVNQPTPEAIVENPDRTVLRPTKTARAGVLTLAVFCIVVLDFLVYISFVGQRLWEDSRLFKDHWFTLPVYLWIGIVLVLGAVVLRLTTQSIVLDEHGIKVRGLFRKSEYATWQQVAGIWMAVDVYRGKKPLDPIEIFSDGHEAFYVMRRGLKRLANISGRFYGLQAQYQVLSRAFPNEIIVHEIDRVRQKRLNQLLPGALSFFDRHSNWFVLALFLFFLAHNVLTFVIWGL